MRAFCAFVYVTNVTAKARARTHTHTHTYTHTHTHTGCVLGLPSQRMQSAISLLKISSNTSTLWYGPNGAHKWSARMRAQETDFVH